MFKYNCTRMGVYSGLALHSVADAPDNMPYAPGLPYSFILVVLMFLMGLGKGGVPGSSTSSVALTALLAPPGPGCLSLAVAMCVPVTCVCDVLVARSYMQHARWDVITRLLPPTGVGLLLGVQLLGSPWMTEARSKLLVGTILLLILFLSLSQSILVPKLKTKALLPNGKVEPPASGVMGTDLDGVPL